MNTGEPNVSRQLKELIPPCDDCQLAVNCAEHKMACGVFHRWVNAKWGRMIDGTKMFGVRDPSTHYYRMLFPRG